MSGVFFVENKHAKKKCPRCGIYYERKEKLSTSRDCGIIVENVVFQCPICRQLQIFKIPLTQ